MANGQRQDEGKGQPGHGRANKSGNDDGERRSPARPDWRGVDGEEAPTRHGQARQDEDTPAERERQASERAPSEEL
jgi:hypothetical protein